MSFHTGNLLKNVLLLIFSFVLTIQTLGSKDTWKGNAYIFDFSKSLSISIIGSFDNFDFIIILSLINCIRCPNLI